MGLMEIEQIYASRANAGFGQFGFSVFPALFPVIRARSCGRAARQRRATDQDCMDPVPSGSGQMAQASPGKSVFWHGLSGSCRGPAGSVRGGAQRGLEIVPEVVDVLDADAQAQQRRW